MTSNCTKLQFGTALLVTLPFLLAFSGAANADPGKTQQPTVGTASFATGNTGAEQRNWHWKSNPEAYRPDGLCDYCGDFPVDTQQTINRDVARNAGPVDAAMSQ
jgi:hypothetical protein